MGVCYEEVRRVAVCIIISENAKILQNCTWIYEHTRSKVWACVSIVNVATGQPPIFFWPCRQAWHSTSLYSPSGSRLFQYFYYFTYWSLLVEQPPENGWRRTYIYTMGMLRWVSEMCKTQDSRTSAKLHFRLLSDHSLKLKWLKLELLHSAFPFVYLV